MDCAGEECLNLKIRNRNRISMNLADVASRSDDELSLTQDKVIFYLLFCYIGMLGRKLFLVIILPVFYMVFLNIYIHSSNCFVIVQYDASRKIPINYTIHISVHIYPVYV